MHDPRAHFAAANRHFAAGICRVADQRARCEWLRFGGQPTHDAERFLWSLELTLIAAASLRQPSGRHPGKHRNRHRPGSCPKITAKPRVRVNPITNSVQILAWGAHQNPGRGHICTSASFRGRILKTIAEVHGMGRVSQRPRSTCGKSARDYAVLRSVACHRVSLSNTISKQIENSLMESEARLLLATASAKLGVYERDVQADTTVWLNDRMYEIFGRSRADGPLTRQDFIDHYLHPDDVPAFHGARNRALESDGSLFVECRIRLTNEAQRWIQIYGTFLFTDNGEPSRLLGVVCDITERKNLEQRAAELADRLVSIQEDERQRIAQELHDSTAQHLVGVSLQLFTLRPPNPTGEARRCWDEVEIGLKQAMTELRTFSYLMHPPGLQADGLCASIRQYVSGYRERSGLETTVRLHPVVDQLPYDMQRALLRIIQEALGNIQRHARASHVAIGLRPFRDTVHVVISDNGQGIESSSSPGRGILGMQVRAARFGGDLRIRGGQNGTKVHAWIRQGKARDRPSTNGKLSLEQTRQRVSKTFQQSRTTAESINSTISDIRDQFQALSGRIRVNSSEF